jgi:hypothetical protein
MMNIINIMNMMDMMRMIVRMIMRNNSKHPTSRSELMWHEKSMVSKLEMN